MTAPTENRNALHVDAHAKVGNNSGFADRIMAVLPLPAGSTVLEVGCGGAELSCALGERYGLDCTGVEPFPIYAPRIDPARVIKSTAEQLPFDARRFDLVIAKDVLEHVDDVERTLDEMLRVSRKYVYLMSPNYLFPYEAHFKVPYPPLLPKWLGRLYLRLFGFTTEQIGFLGHIQYVTKPRLLRALRRSSQQADVLAVIDLQLAKRFRRWGALRPAMDMVLNDKVEFLIVKK